MCDAAIALFYVGSLGSGERVFDFIVCLLEAGDGR